MLLMEFADGVILDGHYRLRQLLGRGGMGEVWEAEHTRLPKLFAIKFLLALGKAEPELLMRFKREAEIASRLAHPSIVQVTDFNILPDGTAYIAMERLVGEDLRARLGRGPLTLADAREITRQVASALQLAHQSGIIHRDLKPENIFLCREPDGALRAKVLDFGISKLQQNLAAGAVSTRDDRVLGTPGYMAPEQAMGKNSSIDGRTDLFALATIVYEMLTGQGVFKGDTLAELCTKVLYHTPPPLDEVLPAVPRALAVAVSTALSKDPAMRQAEIRVFAEAVVGERLGVSHAPSAVSSTGFAATVASDAGAVPSVALRALAGQPDPREALPVDASDAVTRSARPSEPAASQPARPGRARAIAGAAVGIALLIAGTAYLQTRREAKPHATPLDLPSADRGHAPAPADSAPRPSPPETVPTPAETPTVTSSRAEHDAGTLVADRTRPQRDLAQAKLDPGALSNAVRGRDKAGSSTKGTDQDDPALSPGVRATLDDADRALAQGDASGALRLARSSLREANSERAYVIMARAYCAQHDVGMLQAMLRNLSAPVRKKLERECAAQTK